MKQTNKKIMTRWIRVNNYYSYVECARPSTLRQARALQKMGYCVETLTEKVMKNFLSVFEYTYQEFCEHYNWKDIKWMAPEMTFKDIIQDDGKIWVSDREGEDDWVIPSDELEDMFEIYLDNINFDIISEALSLLEMEEADKNYWNEIIKTHTL